MRRILLTLPPLACLVAGCSAPTTGPNFPNRCGPEFGVMIGRNIGQFTLPPGLAHRIVQPGATLSEDFNPARLNVFVDDKGWIQQVECR